MSALDAREHFMAHTCPTSIRGSAQPCKAMQSQVGKHLQMTLLREAPHRHIPDSRIVTERRGARSKLLRLALPAAGKASAPVVCAIEMCAEAARVRARPFAID